MFGALRFNDMVTVLDGIHAASQSTSEKLTAAVDLSKYRRVVFVVDVGVEGTSATVDFQVKGSATSGGSYTAITGTAITQLVKASNDNNYAIVDVDVSKVEDLALGYEWLKGSLLPGTAASLAAVIVLGLTRGYEPASADNATTVAQSLAL